MRTIRGRIFDAEGTFKYGEIAVGGNSISGLSFCEGEKLSELEKQRIIIPGLIDIHLHGAKGRDACSCDVTGLEEIASYERSNGITSFCIATMTLDRAELTRICGNISSAVKKDIGIKGIYLEGPFISEYKAGAQNSKYILQPDYELYRELQNASEESVRIVTVAPEIEGALEFIDRVCNEDSGEEKGCRVSIAHTTATAKETKKAFEAGAKQVTHLYNAMTPMSHREPGVVGAAADSEEVMVELICDGIHVDPIMVRNTFRLFGNKRIILISDSMEATGMPDGDYILGDLPVSKHGRQVTLVEKSKNQQTIAGSASNLYQCMVEAIKYGISAEDAIMAATRNPAIAIGINDKVGSIEKGKAADLLILNDRFELVSVISGEEDLERVLDNNFSEER